MAHVARVLTVALSSKPSFDEWYSPLLAAIKSKADYAKVEDAQSAIQALARRPPPFAVLIPDEGLTGTDNVDVWDAVLEYVRHGGTAIVMGYFSSFAQYDDIKAFFARAGLPWAVASYTRTIVAINKPVVAAVAGMASADKLPASYSQKALFLKNVAPDHIWYKMNDEAEKLPFPGQAAVALGNVGDGKLGYVGDVNGEVDSQTVIVTMCGLLGL